MEWVAFIFLAVFLVVAFGRQVWKANVKTEKEKKATKSLLVFRKGEAPPKGAMPAIGHDGKVDPVMTALLDAAMKSKSGMVLGNIDDDGTLTVTEGKADET